ncbi:MULTISPECIES: shikimate dehydrogenase [unclassified Leptospira]|uniref:shikimate dehydrogenase n=1 Tax=unclassified Leptospira TaxID=2633828 RepID=UPI0002BF5ED0|nr:MULTISPECIES: shikimate dehydrogenase [unclassified Leptospira]EMJ98956.1 shikimate dehydrogenase [Leptospira sp. B5-022]MCR1794136.1 shikimate dehydrogenase [Leptospira sp. id769339]
MKIFRDSSKYFGIVGRPLSHTLSPLLHTSWYEDLSLDCGYLVFPVETLEKKELLSLSKFGVRGLSVTIPHKEIAFLLADKTDETSQAVKASNTLIFENGSISAHNTDGIGAVRSVKESFPESLKGKVLLIGSGGSARGISFTLLKEAGAKDLTIAARNPKTSEELIGLLSKTSSAKIQSKDLNEVQKDFSEYSLIIHTTPLGMKGKDPGPAIPESCFVEGQIVFDIVYNPLETPLVLGAKKKGAKIVPGTDMLLYQAVEQFRLFTGVNLSTDLIEKGRSRLLNALGYT